ncbi:MAG: peptide chain release factor 1 [Acidobacteriota bacterium]|nr:peptide chain release factor 1 [Acidobacteriota bacterium]
MLEKLRALEADYEQISRQLGDPQVVASRDRYREAARTYAELRPLVEKYRAYRRALHEAKDLEEMAGAETDFELAELAKAELTLLEVRLAEQEGELRILLLPRDPNDEKNAILEIRAGTGGVEASLFAQEVFRMYVRYAESHGWRVDIISAHATDAGGLKEVSATIEGKQVYGRLKFESGVHRVQRVPQTETQGRVHTSAVTVAVLPEADDVDVKIQPKDLRWDTYCSSGPGGQSVNTTYSAVRVTHIPTGEVVTCQDEKSQLKNKNKALKVLRSRLYERARRDRHDEMAATRRALVGSGDRSEKIRTYNFPQNRITDHRIGVTLHRLEAVLGGALDDILDRLTAFDQAEALKAQKIA